MARATVNGLSVAYDVIGDGRPWAITPGGRFSKDVPGVRESRRGLAAVGGHVLVWTPNCGASDVCFDGSSESALQADTLAALLRHLDIAPAVVTGGSGGSRVRCSRRSRTARWPPGGGSGGSAAGRSGS